MAKQTAYGLSRTVLYLGLSQDKALQSVRWMRRQIEHNSKFTEAYSLKPGKKWQDTECEIRHDALGQTTTLIAYGVTGSVRGVNIDDWRPDLIIADDILNEENTATKEQRTKMSALLYGALIRSLSPATESPHAKLVMLQTPMGKEDASTKALKDPGWLNLQVGCWSYATADLPTEEQESVWEERFPSKTLREEKRLDIGRNKASVWYREMECKITSPETSSFMAGWLKFYDLTPERSQMTIVIGIDPVPPPSDTQIAKDLEGKDYEAFAVWGAYNDEYYLLEYSQNRGHDPEWSVNEFFRLGLKWQPQRFVVETVGYQKTLEWIFRQAMRMRRIYFVVTPLDDSRSKHDRIKDAFAGPASTGTINVRANHTDFIEQFNDHPMLAHDDLIDACSMALMHLLPRTGRAVSPSSPIEYQPMRDFNYGRGAP